MARRYFRTSTQQFLDPLSALMFTKLQLSGPTHLSTVELIRDHQEADKHMLEVKSKMKYLVWAFSAKWCQ